MCARASFKIFKIVVSTIIKSIPAYKFKCIQFNYA